MPLSYIIYYICKIKGEMTMKDLPQISAAEYKVMKTIWQHAPVNTNEVISILTRSTDWNPKTIQTLLKRLVQKKAVTYEKEGRIFVYTPLVQEQEYLEFENSSCLKRFYNGNLVSMFTNFIEQEDLSRQEIDDLRDLLDKK